MKTSKLLAWTCFIMNVISIPLNVRMICDGYKVGFNVVLLLMVTPGFILACNEIFKKSSINQK